MPVGLFGPAAFSVLERQEHLPPFEFQWRGQKGHIYLHYRSMHSKRSGPDSWYPVDMNRLGYYGIEKIEGYRVVMK